MAKEAIPLLSFNRGIISKLALARVDLKRTALSAEIQTNWMPRLLGSMMLRPGLAYIDSTHNNAQAVHIPFIFDASDTAILELTDSILRVRVNETAISRVSVSTAVSNGTFNTNLTGWTDADQSGATSDWVAGGYMGLTGTTFNAAIRKQTVTVSGGDQNKEHALRIVVAKHSVTLRVGSSDGADDYIAETTLRTGTYSLAFTPTGNFYVQVSNLTDYQALLDSISIETSGVMTLPTPWVSANLTNIRWDQSGDVVFVACGGLQQRRIERHGTRSWGVALYAPIDGPLRTANLTNVQLTPSDISGDITLTASQPLFYPTQVGGLFSITSTGQTVSAAISGDGQWSDPIRVVGVGGAREFSIDISGTWVGTVRLQTSLGSVGSWADVSGENWSGNTSTTYRDGLDNQIAYFRIGMDTGDYTSGTADVTLTFAAGGLTGTVRITAFSDSKTVSASVLTHLGGTAASSDWSEGAWSDYRGWPSAVCFYEGRLWWAGKDKIYGSVSDAFESFDDTIEGDSGPLSRSIGSGPVDKINWLLPLLRLIVGCQLGERSARSSSLDEPLTPTNFSLKEPSTRGSSAVPALKVDGGGIFVRGSRLFLTSFNETYSVTSDYAASDLTIICPEVGQPHIIRIAVQRYPDTRIHCVRSDGTVAVLIFDPAEDEKCWVLVETDGTVEDVFVLPGSDTDGEDKVYYTVNRTINSSTKRYLERWALESECQGGTTNKQADSYIVYTGAATTTITGLGHLEGKTVVVWGNGKDLGTKVVTSGQITGLSEAVTNAVVGLGYTAQFKSTKLAYAAAGGTALTKRKRLDHLGLILVNTHAQGLLYGTDFDNLDGLPLIDDEGQEVDANYIWPTYDKDSFSINDKWSTDSRLCLQAAAPRPCTVSAAVIDIQTNA